MIGRTRHEIGAQTPTAHSDVFARSRSDLLGSRDLGCPRMEEVLRAPAEHGVSSLLFFIIFYYYLVTTKPSSIKF